MIQYNNYLMKREQSRAGSRFAECEKSRLKAKILITLALLLTAVTGAWADGKVYTSAVDITALQVGDILTEGASINGSGSIIFDNNRVKVNGTLQTEGFCYLYTDDFDSFGAEGVISLSNNTTMSPVDKDNNDGNAWEVTQVSFAENNNRINIQGITYAPAPTGPEVAWDASTKTGTFTMPGSDVVLTPQYAPAAQLAEGGAPAPVSGLEIAADAAIITAGQSAQGTLLYAVGTSETEKPALTDFAATLPNAKDLTAAGNYYVWYYIQGQDTPQGQEPTAENTFNDSEIMGPVTVELLTNEHTLNIKQSPNITVTVAGTAVTPTDDKVTPVITGQEVKIKAKEGYKFRKVEVKKGGAAGPVTYTELKGGEVLHVGDKIQVPETDKYWYPGGETLDYRYTYEVVRVNISGSSYETTATESETGAYYALHRVGSDYYLFATGTIDDSSRLPATATSDGIAVADNGFTNGYHKYIFSVHEK